MNTLLEGLKRFSTGVNLVSEQDIKSFERKTQLLMPSDFANYFKEINGSDDEYVDKLFKFYSLDQFKNVQFEFKDWHGSPKYSDLLSTMTSPENVFVFCDYQFHLFTYAVRLNINRSNIQEIYILCGGDYKTIATSLNEFLELYFSDSPKLYFED